MKSGATEGQNSANLRNASLTDSGNKLANYSVTNKPGTLTVTARALTVTADAQIKVYGITDPALTYKVTNGSLANSDAFSGALTRDAGENVGSYTINQNTLALNSNYVLTYVSAKLTITARALTVTADPQTKIYGAPDPTLTYKITVGSRVNGDAFSGALTRDPGENVGTYAIQQGTLSLGNNYAIRFVNADLTITYGACPLYDPSRSVKSGATYPIKLYLCDVNGKDLSSPSIVLNATAVYQTSGYTGQVEDAGSANPDNNFRYDSTLGPSGGYIFNLKTTGLPSGTFGLKFMAGASGPYSLGFGVK